VAAVGRRRGIKIRKAQTLSGPFSFQPHPALSRHPLQVERDRKRRHTVPGGVRGNTPSGSSSQGGYDFFPARERVAAVGRRREIKLKMPRADSLGITFRSEENGKLPPVGLDPR
jgi:hypothetical protein